MVYLLPAQPRGRDFGKGVETLPASAGQGMLSSSLCLALLVLLCPGCWSTAGCHQRGHESKAAHSFLLTPPEGDLRGLWLSPRARCWGGKPALRSALLRPGSGEGRWASAFRGRGVGITEMVLCPGDHPSQLSGRATDFSWHFFYYACW